MKVEGLYCFYWDEWKLEKVYTLWSANENYAGPRIFTIHNPFTNERINVYMDKHSSMSMDIKDYFV